MDGLELLKKDWNKKQHFPQLSYDEIYKLIQKKSSSIVKWLLIICAAEFTFWTVINLLMPDEYMDVYEEFHLKTFLYVVQALHYIILFGFIYLFYKNYKAICVIDNTKRLMSKILKTRKTVNYYVYYNIGLYIILSIIINIVMFSQPEILADAFLDEGVSADSDKFVTIFVIVQIFTMLIICGILWLWYRIIYGILLRRLKKNYNELKSLKV
ncbi:MAG TPA: hypothetical protein VJ970_01035 [Flavobacteriaceae bacterium]|nr:hypothetical protein [Flavobacteriaceae bacterium]